MLNSKHRSLIPAREPWSYYVANRRIPLPCINLLLNPKKCLNSKTWPRNVKWLQHGVLAWRGNYARNKPAGRNDQPQIILFIFTKRQLIWGSDTNFPQANSHAFFFFLYLLLNTKEMSVERESMGETSMNNRLRSASNTPFLPQPPPLSDQTWQFCTHLLATACAFTQLLCYNNGK